MRKRRFTYAERFAVWDNHERRCLRCCAPLRFVETTIDHVVPGALLKNDKKRREIIAAYDLPESFDINGFENWLPRHNHCNQKKGAKEFRFVPGYAMIFDMLIKLAPSVRQAAINIKMNAQKDRLFAKIFDSSCRN